MGILEDVRQKYPTYKDWSDEELAEGLRKKFYADMPPDQYYGKLGMKEPGIQGPMDAIENIGQGFNKALGTGLNAAGYALGGFMMGDSREEQARHPLMYAGQVLKGERDIPGMEGTRFSRPAVTRGEQVFQAGGEAVAAGLPVAGGLVAGGRAIAQPVGNTAQKIGQMIAQDANRMAVAKPAAAAALEVSAGTGSGMGENIGGDSPYLPEGVGQVVGGLAGGAAGSINLPRLAIKGGGRVVEVARGLVDPTVQADRAKKVVAKQLGPELESKEVQDNLQRAQQLRQQIPGFNPDLAEATQSPALIATKSDIVAQSRGGDLDAQRARGRKNQATVQQFIQDKAPRGQGDNPELAFDPLMERRRWDAVQLRELQEQKQGIAIAQRDMPAKISEMKDDLRRQTVNERGEFAAAIPRVDRVRVGQELRQDIQIERSRRAKEIGEEFRALDSEGLDFKQPFTLFNRDVKGWRDGLSIERRQNLPQGIMDDVKAISSMKRVPHARLKQLREDLGHHIRAVTAQSDSGARIRGGLAMELRDKLDRLVFDADQPGMGDLNDRWKAARQRWKDEIIDPFEHGEVLEVRRLDNSGYYRTNDEELALRILGSASGSNQFMDIARNNPRMVQHLQGAVLDDLASTAVRNGKLTPKNIRDFSEKYRDALANLPAVKGTVDTLQKAVDDLEAQIADRASGLADYRRNAPKQLVDTQRVIDQKMQPLLQRMGLLAERTLAVEDTMLARRLTSLDRGATGASGLIKQAVGDPVFMKKLVFELGGLQGKEGQKAGRAAIAALRRHVWDGVTRDMDPDQIADFMEKNKASLKILFTSAHMKNLAAARDALRIMKGAQVTAAKGKPIRAGYLDRFEMATGMNVPQSASRWRGVHTGRSSKWVEAADSFGRWLNKRGEQAMNRTMREVLYNPEVAQALVTTLQTSSTGLPTKPLRAWLWRLGIAVPVEVISGGQENAQDQ